MKRGTSEIKNSNACLLYTSVFIPNGAFELKDNDLVSIIGSPQNSANFFRKIGIVIHPVKNTMIIGGGTIAHYLAKRLIATGIRVRIIENNKERRCV